MLALGLAFFAIEVGRVIGGSVTLYAMICGLMISAFISEDIYGAGLDLMTGSLLKIAIALLGMKISFAEVASLGSYTIVVIVLSIIAGLAISIALSRWFGLTTSFGAIAGAAVSICGVSAALAAASLYPKNPAVRRDTFFVAFCVTALSTVAMVAYPILGAWLALGDTDMGSFLGASIHDLAHVVAAGYGVSDRVGASAVIVKLLRVALLAPAVGAVAVFILSRGTSSYRPPFPWFIAGFATLMLWNTAGLIPPVAGRLLGESSGLLLLAAIAAISLKAKWQHLKCGGLRQLSVIVIHTALLLAFSIYVFGFRHL